MGNESLSRFLTFTRCQIVETFFLCNVIFANSLLMNLSWVRDYAYSLFCVIDAQNLPLGNYEYSYGGWWSVWWMGTYSMVLSKAAFIHEKYFDMYTNQMPASVRQYVKEKRY